MTPSAGHLGHPREDRLERLLRAGGEPAPGVDRADETDSAEPGWQAAGRSTSSASDRRPTDDALTPAGRHRDGRVPLLSVPAALRSADLSVGVRAVRGLLVVVVVATIVLGGRWLWTQRAAMASPSDRVAVSAGGEEVRTDASPTGGHGDEVVGGATEVRKPGAEGSGGAEGDEGASADTAVGDTGSEAGTPAGEEDGSAAASAGLVVHVAGEVLQPGVVSLPAGSRVVDAVRAAGGTTDEADQSTLNLARPLVDGERVWVGRPGETPPVVAPGPLPRAGGAGGRGGAGGDAEGGAAGSGPSAPLDLNSATQADLEELPGIGPVTAGHILTWREEHDRFSSVDELLEVSGIGERTLAQLAPLVTVGG